MEYILATRFMAGFAAPNWVGFGPHGLILSQSGYDGLAVSKSGRLERHRLDGA
jgi:hypothetical protein